MKQTPRFINAAIATLFLLLITAAAAHGATYTVTNTQDSGAGSLRDAINQANATIEADTIEFQIPSNDEGCAGGACTITLTGGELLINKDLTMNGPGAKLLTISGNDMSRVLNIQSSIAYISGLTVSHGKRIVQPFEIGGGFLTVNSTVTIANSNISNNSANFGGGIFNHSSTVTIINSTISSNKTIKSNQFSSGGGGGIYNQESAMVITNCAISNNFGTGGGGIFHDGGKMAINNSAFVDNISVANGGGILNYKGISTVTNSTFSGNSAVNGGGIDINSGTLTIVHSTITKNFAVFNGGGLYNSSGAIIVNSIIAGNTSPGIPDVNSYFGPHGHNLIGGNPLLGPLQNNGGATLTHALLAGSPAINAGDNCVTEATHCGDDKIPQITTDQRGFPRPADSSVDIGAYELQPTNPLDDAQFFVRQHYLDFLNREPDAAGLSYWTDQITQCGADTDCVNRKRVDVSAAFFTSQEFQETGSFVYRLYQAAYGARPTYAQFTGDRTSIIGGQNLEANKSAFVDEFVTRPQFKTAYPDSLSNADFVNKLFDTANLRPYVAERQARIVALTLHTETRAQVLRDVAEFSEFKAREYNPSFVLMQYFGYLKRDADEAGYEFWLGVLNNGEANNYRGMVCSFITSEEYQKRFSSLVTHSNAECSQ